MAVHVTQGETDRFRISNAINKNADELETKREVLSSNRTYYVRTDGSDSNTGLANTSDGAFLTLQKAWDVILTLDLGGFEVTVSVQSGTYTAGVSMTSAPVGGLVTFAGSSATVSVTSGNCFSLLAPTTVTVSGFTLQTTTSGQCLYAVGGGSKFVIGSGMTFGSCAGAHLWCQSGAQIASVVGYTITGTTVRHILSILGSSVDLAGITVTLSSTPVWTSEFAYVNDTGSVSFYLVTFSGSATGKRYAGFGNGVINSYGAGTPTSYFPGNSNGTTATGAQQV